MQKPFEFVASARFTPCQYSRLQKKNSSTHTITITCDAHRQPVQTNTQSHRNRGRAFREITKCYVYFFGRDRIKSTTNWIALETFGVHCTGLRNMLLWLGPYSRVDRHKHIRTNKSAQL